MKIDLVAAPGGKSGSGMWAVDLSNYWFTIFCAIFLCQILWVYTMPG